MSDGKPKKMHNPKVTLVDRYASKGIKSKATQATRVEQPGKNLTSKQIDHLTDNKNYDDADQNAFFERDMRKDKDNPNGDYYRKK